MIGKDQVAIVVSIISAFIAVFYLIDHMAGRHTHSDLLPRIEHEKDVVDIKQRLFRIEEKIDRIMIK